MKIKILKILVFIAALLPLANLVYGFFTDNLGANPIEKILHQTGYWALTLLLVTLAITPLRKITRWNRIINFRRMIGLFAFFYACLHFTVYLVLDRQLYWSEIVDDISKRPYITVGFSALVLLIPLAVTSTKGWIRKLGKTWTKLHRLIYLIAIAGVVHFWWQVKKDISEPLIFALILTALLLFRMAMLVKKKRAQAASG
jgi:sulfoxide reductase heme-binding subunit YedZ